MNPNMVLQVLQTLNQSLAVALPLLQAVRETASSDDLEKIQKELASIRARVDEQHEITQMKLRGTVPPVPT